MDVFQVMEKSYIYINNNLDFYKEKFGHVYYMSVSKDETGFIDKTFKKINNNISDADKMLNYSVSTLYTATAVLLEMMNKKHISYSNKDIEQICPGFGRFSEEKIEFNDSCYEKLEELLFGLLTDGIDLESRKKSGSERTPDDIINYMLDIVEYKGKNVENKTIIDPACGTGTFIARIVERYVEWATKYDAEYIVESLINDKLIKAYDTKPSNVYVTKLVVICILIRLEVISSIDEIKSLMLNLPIYCDDFLKAKDKADFVVGNPPYIRLQNLPIEYRNYIKDNFASATGRFDIYTCFIEAACQRLNDHGKVCLITSNKYLTANYGEGIRKYLINNVHVNKIVDLHDTKFFGAAVLPAIIFCERNQEKKNDIVEYFGIKSTLGDYNAVCKDGNELFDFVENTSLNTKQNIKFDKEDVVFEVVHTKTELPNGGNTWNFTSTIENDLKLKIEKKKYCLLENLFDICVGIKSTADTVFVKPMTSEFIDTMGFERELIYPLVQSFNVEKWKITWGEANKDRFILYPHLEVNGSMFAVPLDQYPNVKEYLYSHEEVLKSRTYLMESQTREWYECWVPQKLSKFRQPKLVTRDIVSHNSFAYDTKGMICQGNTFFLTKKDSVFSVEYKEFSEDEYFYFMLGVLNSNVMEYYQKMISGSLYSKKYRYTTSNMSRWPIPKVDKNIAKIISKLAMKISLGMTENNDFEREINCLVYEIFELSEQEIIDLEAYLQVNA